MMDIEAIVKKHLYAWKTSLVVNPEACAIAALEEISEALTELSAAHAIELRAYEATVQNMESRIRQMEAERVPEGWVIDRANDEIIIRNHEIGGCVVQRSPTESRVIPESILWELANAMLAAAQQPKKE